MENKNNGKEIQSTEKGEIVIYQPDEITRLEVRVKDESVWLTQAQMSELLGRDRTVITKHIRNIFTEEELDEKAMCIFCTLQIRINRLNCSVWM